MKEWNNRNLTLFLFSCFFVFLLSCFPSFSWGRGQAGEEAGEQAAPLSADSSKIEGETSTFSELGKMALNKHDLESARVFFKKALAKDNQNAEAHYFLGVIEYESGNIEAAKERFRLAHAAVSNSKQNVQKAELQFPEGYNVRVYYKDGWYLQSKKAPISKVAGKASTFSKPGTYSFQTGSTYKVLIKEPRKRKLNLYAKLLVGVAMLSWLASR